MNLKLHQEKFLQELKNICGAHKYAIKYADGEVEVIDEGITREALQKMAAKHGGHLYIYSKAHGYAKLVIA